MTVNNEKKNGAVRKVFGSRASLIFYIGLGVIVLGALIAIFKFNGYLEKYLADYEATRPKYTVENIFKEYFEAPDFVTLTEKAGCNISDSFNKQEDLIKYFENLTKDKNITHVYVAGSDKTKVNVKADGKKFAAFTVKKSSKPSEYGFDVYELDEIKLFYSADHSVKFRIPFNYKAMVNGVLLTDEHKTKTGITDDKRETIPEGTYKFSYDEYEVKGLILPPEFALYDSKNNEVTAKYDEENNIYTADFVYDDTLKTQHESFVLEAAEKYAGRIQNSGVTMNTIKKYFEYGTETYERIRLNPNSFVWDYDSYHFENESTGNYYAYDENTFSCNVEMIQVMCKKGQKDYREKINVTLYLRCGEDGKYMIYDLQTNLA